LFIFCRWHNHLHPDIKKTPWSEAEEKIISEAHARFGRLQETSFFISFHLSISTSISSMATFLSGPSEIAD
jgi:hypothetical protein